MRAAVVGEWIVITGGWSLFRTMREQVLTPTVARQVAEWCDEQGDFASSAELRWAAREAEKWRPEDESVEQADDIIDIIERIDEVLSTDSMEWSPVGEDEKKRILAGRQDERPRSLPVGQIHAIPVEQVAEWTTWWDRLSEAYQADTPWYVVCHEHKTAGERDVPCGCGNPSNTRDSR